MKIVIRDNENNFENHGTGWFLDHEIPVFPKKYPTKWFLATNAHVIDDYHFLWDAYNQNPKVTFSPLSSPKDLYLYRWESGGYDEMMLRAQNIDFEDHTFWTSEKAKTHNPHFGFLPPSRDVLTVKKNWHRKLETPSMHIKIPHPKLFYAAFDELKYPNGNTVNYFLDFAVLEINFPNEDSAKKMTEQIYNKPENERIDFMGEVNEKTQFYTAGYPGNSFNPFRPVGNYSVTRDMASNKSFCYLINTFSTDMQKWNGKEYRNERCYYQLDNLYAGKGSSGSMVVDEDGTLLGLHSRGDAENGLGYVQPIRGKSQICGPLFCQKYLEYDLITGSQFQTTSYKQQLLWYMPHIDTYLKNKYKWKKTPTQSNN